MKRKQLKKHSAGQIEHVCDLLKFFTFYDSKFPLKSIWDLSVKTCSSPF